MELAGKVALVTGAGRGIGEAISESLAGHGAQVAVNDIHVESAEQVCRQLTDAGHEAIAVSADVADQDAVNAMVDRIEAEFGSVDLLINNAAAPAEFFPFQDTTPQAQHEELVTFPGVLHCTRRVLPGMISAKRGRVINISSVASRHGLPGRAVYSGANAGIEAFSKALSAEVGQHGITINCISPGAIESPRFKARSKQVRQAVRQIISLDYFGEPAQIAQAVLFLASDMSDYVTGVVLDVDGGYRSYLPWKDATE